MEQGKDAIDTGVAKSLDKIQFAKIPGTTNYRSGQPTLQQLEYIIKEYDIKNIIRLNGNEGNDPTSRAGGTVYTDQERDLAEKLGVTFYPKSGEFVNAHDPWGGKKGKGYVNSIARVKRLLNKGNTLIHCRNGADRTGYLVAKYLQDTQGWNDEQELWNYTIQYNHWCKMGKFIGSGYDKYAQGFIKNLDHEKFKQLCKNSYEFTDDDTDDQNKTTDKEGLSYGDTGLKVVDMQQRLIYVLDDPFAVGPMQDDGIFGPYTEEGLKKFQRKQGFDASGIYDEESEIKLKELTADVTDEELKLISAKTNNIRVEYNGTTDKEFYEAILKGIGAPITEGNMAFFAAWRQSEGGRATNNPFNTTYRLSADKHKTDYNSAGVKNYSTPEYGIEATIKTLLLPYYTNIVNDLKNDAGAIQIASNHDQLTTWGTGTLVSKVLNRGNINPPHIYDNDTSYA